jgi:fatty-acyl-CoA synthase
MAAYDTPLLIGQLLLTPLATCPGREIVYRDLVRQDYRTTRDRIGRLAGFLSELGVEHGDVVAVMDWDSHRYLEAYFAIPMMGATLMTVNVRLSPEQIVYTVDHAEARVLLVHADFLPLLDKLRDHLPKIERFVLLTDQPSAAMTLPPGFDAEYEAGLAAAGPDFPFEDFDENTRATLFYTTGTTGLPKGVFFSHRQLVLHTLSTAAALGRSAKQGRVHRESVYMPMTPMFHVHAWGVPYLATMLGMKQVYPGRYAPDMLAKLIADENVSFSHGVPTILQMLLACPEAAETDLSGLTIVVGGSALPRGLAAAALARGIDIFAGYGLSESCPILTLAQLEGDLSGDPEAELDLRICAGQPVPLVDLRILDEAMQPLASDGTAQGEIVVRAPWLTKAYHQDDDASERLWAGGYMHTNDIGTLDERGYLRITDRLKDVIKTGGEWVSSLELESLISRHPSVAEAAVIAVRDAHWGERPLALVVPKPGETADPNALKDHLRGFVATGEISKFAVPERVLAVEAIDKTSVGKIDKKRLRQKYAG